MEPSEAKDGYEEEGDDDHDDDGDDCSDSLQLLRLFVIEDEDEAEDKDADHVKREGDEEHEEVAVVPTAWNIFTSETYHNLNCKQPMQLLTQGQWWSNISMQLLQTEQWLQRGGR